MADVVEVDLGDRSYPIFIGKEVLLESRQVLGYITGAQVAVITNEVVAPLWLDPLTSVLRGGGLTVDVFTLADGESQKTLGNYERVMDFLVARRHNRSTTVVALGGGVVGDLAGFAAATYQRGVAFVQVPTTLLAQVDSSVGGKTAVNHPQGKNLIGAFYQPRAVFADTGFLHTLPVRELRAGLAEVLKYGIIRDAGLFTWLLENAESLLRLDTAALTHAVRCSCEIKARVVHEDERETGIRAILNFGHTFGHALEALTGFTQLLHGEAVAIGMVMAADLSWRCGLLSGKAAGRVKMAVAALGLPVEPPATTPEDMLRVMGMDKKVIDGQLRLILTDEIGSAFVADDVDPAHLRATLAAGPGLCDG
jgi:3-dehydroquinate synthase